VERENQQLRTQLLSQ
jgi:hypothetical protein